MLVGSLSGVVFVDADADGQRDAGEVGVPGVVVSLSGSETGGAVVNRSTLTDDAGTFTIGALNAGTYQLLHRQPTAMIDGTDATSLQSAVAGNDSIANVVLAADQNATGNNFGERGVRPQFVSLSKFLATTPPVPQQLREIIAVAEELAGNLALAQSIRSGGGTVLAEGDDENDDVNVPFLAVTIGPFDAPNLLGVRTDLQPGAPPITQTHVSTAIDYSGFSNPPTYGPHHGPINDEQGNSITPRPTGVYATQQPDEDLVHNLEHGHVWISYNPALISVEDKARLEAFVTAGGTNTGVILTPRPQNTTAIAVASWAHLLTLDTFDAAQVRAFVNTNRGHAPEGFIPSGQKGTTAASELLGDGLPHTPA